MMKSLSMATSRIRRKRARNHRLHPFIESLEVRKLLDGQGFNLGELAGRREVSGVLLNPGDSSNDVVTFRLSAPGWVDARCDFAFPNSNGPGALKLLDAGGKQIAADSPTSGVGFSTAKSESSNQSSPVRLAPGVYQIRVGRTEAIPNGADPGYKLFLIADHAGDDFKDARDGGVLDSPRSYTDFVGTLGDIRADVDYYRFTVPSARKMQAALTIDGAPTYYGFQIAVDTDNDGRIDSYLTQPTSPGAVEITVPAGTIYVVVGFGSNGATPMPSYTLSVSAFDTPTSSSDPLFVDYGQYGIWRWTAAGGMRQILAADPENMAVAADGSLFVDFGRFGTWRWTEPSGWRSLRSADPQGMAAATDGSVYFDYGAEGLWRWTDAGGFVSINAADPQGIATGPGGVVYVDYGRFGLWRWTAAAGMNLINAADPETLAVGTDGVLYVDYGRFGLWRWIQGSGMLQISTADAQSIVAGPGGELYVDFGVTGLWRYSAGGFSLVIAADPENIIAAADGRLYVDFGKFGLYQWAPNSGMRLINAANPQKLAVRTPTGSSSTSNPPTANPPDNKLPLIDVQKELDQLIKLINDYRLANGAGDLRVHSVVVKAADLQATQMVERNTFDHILPGAARTIDGVAWPTADPSQRLRAVGYTSLRGCWENLASAVDAARAFEMWRNSPSHDAGMLVSQGRDIGVAMAYNPTTNERWWVMLIACR